jgi:hypothetical protein
VSTGPHVTTSITHADPRPTPTALPSQAPPPAPAAALSELPAAPAGPDDTSSLTRPDMRRVAASRHLAAQLLPDGVTVDQIAVGPGDGLIGAATRTALATVPDAGTLLRDGAAARLIGERDRLAAEVARLRAGAAGTTGDPHEVPTPAQIWAGLLSMDGDGRLQTIAAWGHERETARRCRDLQHDPRIADLERQLRQSHAREAELERELDQLRPDTHQELEALEALER